MSSFRDTLPEFFSEVEAGLDLRGWGDIAANLAKLSIRRRFSPEEHRGLIELRPGKPIPAPERASRSGSFRWLSVSVERGNVELRLDQDDRLREVSYFARSDVGRALDRAGVTAASSPHSAAEV